MSLAFEYFYKARNATTFLEIITHKFIVTENTRKAWNSGSNIFKKKKNAHTYIFFYNTPEYSYKGIYRKKYIIDIIVWIIYFSHSQNKWRW